MTTPDIVGNELPGGSYTVRRWMSFLWADATQNERDVHRYPDAVESEDIDGVLVPSEFATQIAVAGSGTSIEGLLSDMGMDWDSGVFYAGQELNFDQQLRTGISYQVTGEIGDVTEKGGDSGPFHLVTIEFHAKDESGDPVFNSRMKIIVR